MTAKRAGIGTGSVFIQSWAVVGLPRSLGFEMRPLGFWQLIADRSARQIEEQLDAAGWHFCSLAPAIEAIVFGCGDNVLERAIERLLEKTNDRASNALEITSVVARKFLGLECLWVSALARHLEKEPVSHVMSCSLPGLRQSTSDVGIRNDRNKEDGLGFEQ